MPIYSYRCESCGATTDALQKISDAPLTVCPECGASSLHKQLTAPAFQLKGSGWYVTDFRDNGKAGAESPDKSGKPDEAAPASDMTYTPPASPAPATGSETAGGSTGEATKTASPASSPPSTDA